MVKGNSEASLSYLPTHLPVLDGWRGISISCVLAGHMLPLGPKYWALMEWLPLRESVYFSSFPDFSLSRCCRAMTMFCHFLCAAYAGSCR